MDGKQELIEQISALTERLTTGEARISTLMQNIRELQVTDQGKPIEVDPDVGAALEKLYKTAADAFRKAGMSGVAIEDFFETVGLIDEHISRMNLRPEFFESVRLSS